MSFNKLKVLTLGLIVVLFVPLAASAAPACSAKSSDFAGCVEKQIDVTLDTSPIGQVAYTAPKCSYFIIHTEDDFIFARDIDNKESVGRGEFLFKLKENLGNDLKVGNRRFLLSNVNLKGQVIETGLSAEEAASAYVAQCK